MAHIAPNKQPWHIGFEQSGIAIERPRWRSLPVAKKVRAGQNETAPVALNHITKPFRPRLRADENEQARGGQLLSLSRGSTLDGNSRASPFPFQLYPARSRPPPDIRRFFHFVGQA